MTTLRVRLPDELDRRFLETFPRQDQSALIARLIAGAIERAERERAGRQAAQRILARRPTAPALPEATFRRLRGQDRR